MPRKFVPDLSAFDQFSGKDDSYSRDEQMRIIRRNFELVSKALGDVGLSSSPSQVSSAVTELDEKNYFVRIWQVDKTEEIPSDDIFASTGIKLLPSGQLIVSGELKII